MIIGNANAWIGQDYEHLHGIIGPFEGEINKISKGNGLLDFLLTVGCWWVTHCSNAKRYIN